MTLSDLQIEIENSETGRVRIAGGLPGTEDYDEGYAWLVSPDQPFGIVEYGSIACAWDSGVTTVLPRVLDDTYRILD